MLELEDGEALCEGAATEADEATLTGALLLEAEGAEEVLMVVKVGFGELVEEGLGTEETDAGELSTGESDDALAEETEEDFMGVDVGF